METTRDPAASAQLVRLVERDRPVVSFTLDGAAASARDGDTILTAVLTLRRHLVEAPGEGPRSGFCLMGACQECWVYVDGTPVRACGTVVTDGLRVTTRHPGFGG